MKKSVLAIALSLLMLAALVGCNAIGSEKQDNQIEIVEGLSLEIYENCDPSTFDYDNWYFANADSCLEISYSFYPYENGTVYYWMNDLKRIDGVSAYLDRPVFDEIVNLIADGEFEPYEYPKDEAGNIVSQTEKIFIKLTYLDSKKEPHRLAISKISNADQILDRLHEISAENK